MEIILLSGRFQLADEKGLCPECGAHMNEISRLNESNSAYIWLRCGKNGCRGQWLQKKQCSELKGISSVGSRWKKRIIR